METHRPLYSAVVLDNTDEINTNKHVDEVAFGTYENALELATQYMINTQTTAIETKPLNNPLRLQFLEELAGHLASYVVDVRDIMSFHGFANDLQLFDIMQCLDNNIYINANSDANLEIFSEDDDVN